MVPSVTSEIFKETISRLSTFLISEELSEIVRSVEERVKEKAVVDKLLGTNSPTPGNEYTIIHALIMDIEDLSAEVRLLKDACNSQSDHIREIVSVLGKLTQKSVEVRNDVGSLSNRCGVYLS